MKLFKVIFFPILILIQVLYFLIIFLRNTFYDYKLIPIINFKINIISIGSLKLGGAGKTPLLEYILKEFPMDQLAVLSRGYKRKSTGFLIAKKEHNSFEIGDEVRQLKHKNPDLLIAVDRNKVNGVKNLMRKSKKIQTILLDDGHQHRALGRNLNIIVTEYRKLYIKDQLFPLGNLREYKSGSKRANIIVVTKCPKEISLNKKEKIRSLLSCKKDIMIFFSHIKYQKLVNCSTNKHVELNKKIKYFLITGIASPNSLLEHLCDVKINFFHFKFKDHHYFKTHELKNLIKKGKTQKINNIIITEKDFYRLSESNLLLLKSHFKVLYTQSEFDFINDEKLMFNKQIRKFI